MTEHTEQQEVPPMTSGQKRTEAARLAHRRKAARRHAQSYVDALELIGYTIIPPAPDDVSPSN